MMRNGWYRKEIYDRRRGMCCYDVLSLRVSTYRIDHKQSKVYSLE